MSILKIQKDQELQRLQPYFSKKLQAETDLQIILKKSNWNGQIEMNLKKFIKYLWSCFHGDYFLRKTFRDKKSFLLWRILTWLLFNLVFTSVKYPLQNSRIFVWIWCLLRSGNWHQIEFQSIAKAGSRLRIQFFTLRENHFEIGWMINYIFEWNYTTMQGVTHF